MSQDQIRVKTDRFDGPLSLLLLLIQKHEMSIRDFDLTVITKQYLEFLNKMKELNFDIAGDYLYLAASLIFIKSKSCILEEDEKGLLDQLAIGDRELSREELIKRLEALQRFQALGKSLWSLPKKGHEVFTRPKVNRKAIINSILTPIELDKLTITMIDLLRRNKRKFTVITRDRISIKEKLISLKSLLLKGAHVNFRELLCEDRSNDDTVITFISLLELARLKRISLFQNETFGNIYIDVLESLENFDVNSADGFDDENEDEDEGLQHQPPPQHVEVLNGEEMSSGDLLQ
ncbi:MAG: segregation/condensation protein A [Bacteriovoracaceae bacterium]|jgi:segregation and condensation protein A|nr:segregation/condensation protein A [Bacteriovoracaceae bacterium]